MMTSSEETIKSIVMDCKTANQAYLAYLKKYLRELKEKDAKEDIQSRKADLGFLIIAKKLLQKNTVKEGIQLRELKEPKEYIIPNNLYYIYEDIQQILAKRGWLNPPSKT